MKLTLETTQETTLDARLEQQLRQEFRQYQVLKQRMAALETELQKRRDKIGALRAESGAKSLELDGFKTTLVEPQRRTFDRRKFVSLGGDLTVYDAAHETKPGTPYERITLPGDKPE